jgi:hypothetical protein
MAKFLDHHKMPPLSPEQSKAMLSQIKSMIESKKPDKAGVIYLNVFMSPGEAWGVSEAPNAESIVKSHEAMGIKIKISDIVQVTSVV